MTGINEQIRRFGFMTTSAPVGVKKSGRSRVFRFRSENGSYILKHYRSSDSKRELEWYKLLQELGVKTLRPIAVGPESAVFPDLSRDQDYRIGVIDDWSDPLVASSLASWLKEFHRRGYAYPSIATLSAFNEHDYITPKNVRRMLRKHCPQDESGKSFVDALDGILGYYHTLPRTLMYRDFYYENLVIRNDRSEAFVYDFDVSGTDIAESDIAHVETYLSDNALVAFMEEYGPVDELHLEIGRLFLALFKIMYALDERTVPPWAKVYVDRLVNGSLHGMVQKIASYI